MKRSELFFSAIQVPVDFLMILLASMTAFAIRDIPQIVALKPKLYAFPFDVYIKIIIFVIPFFILIYALLGLYDIRVTRKIWKESVRVFMGTSLGLVIVIVAIFLQRQWFSSRFIILAGWALAFFYVIVARFIIQKIQKWLLIYRGMGVHRVLLIGDNTNINRIKRIINSEPDLGYKIIEQINNASVTIIKGIREKKGIDEIILCDPSVTDPEQEKLIDYCAINNITYQYIPTTLQTSRYELRMFDGQPIIEIKHTSLDGWGRIIKRAFDIFGSVILLILSSPVLIITAAAIALESRGPIIYKNERIGSNGKKFFAYKFRYMKWDLSISRENPNLEKALAYEKQLIKEKSVRLGPLYKIKNDPRRTKVGRIIEKLSIDELPQLFNVVLGEMSLVGPRPHQKREVEKYKEYHRQLLTISPGVTGMAQVAGRSDLNFEDEYKLDVYYIENWSLWLDIQIIFKTVRVLFRKRKNSK